MPPQNKILLALLITFTLTFNPLLKYAYFFRTVIVEDETKISKILDAVSNMPTLKHLVVIKHEAITQELLSKADKAGIQLHKFYELIIDGVNNIQQDLPPKPDDTYMIW